MSFFDEFNGIAKYYVNVAVGKNEQSRTFSNNINSSNYKGKAILRSKKSETLKEVEQYGFGEHMQYVPIDQISMPIDIQITGNEKLKHVFFKTSNHTNKEITDHDISIYDANNSRIGFVSFAITPSGDIYHKTSFYSNPDDTKQLIHIFNADFKNGKIIKDDAFEFIKNSQAGTKKIKVSQINRIVVGCSVLEQDLESSKKYVASCVSDEIDRSKCCERLIPLECYTLENDLLNYQNSLNEFQMYAKKFKERTGLDLSIEKAAEIWKLPYLEREKQGFLSTGFVAEYYLELAAYLSDKNNDLLSGFKGNYIGNILRLTDDGYEACIVTKKQKDNQDYRIYTLIDLTGTSIVSGTSIDDNRDSNYLERLKEASKIPAFVTKVGKDGKEELVLYYGEVVTDACPEYNKFVENFISPFSEIKPIKISQFFDKQSEKDK